MLLSIGAGIPCMGQNALDIEVSMRVRNAPLRMTLVRLADSHRVSFLLDRRVDPGQPVSLELQALPLHAAFDRVAEHAEIQTLTVGESVYLGPEQGVIALEQSLERTAQKLSALSPTIRRRYRRQAETHWPDATEPRAILNEMLAGQNLRLSSPANVPHDLWPAGSLSQAPLCDRLSLLLVGFGLDWMPDPEAPNSVLVFGHE